jgi:hypothetical protein
MLSWSVFSRLGPLAGGPECREGGRRTMVEQTRGGLCQKLRNLQIQHTDHLPEVVGIPGTKKRKVKADGRFLWLLPGS